MTQQELTEQNLGQSLDDLTNLDPRGYGVCKILYAAARKQCNQPLTMHAAKELQRLLSPGDYVYLLTGFVLRPFQKAETDGIIGTILLARALTILGIRPVIITQDENLHAAHVIAAECGLHVYDSVEEIRELPFSIAVLPFPKDKTKASEQAKTLLEHQIPRAVISIEAPGANALGEYHNATGLNMTELEAKLDVLFTACQAAGVWNLAIGDLGNEIGMGKISGALDQWIPYAAKGSCRCGCGGGIAAATAADHLITTTVSDWGTYGLIAALAFLSGNLEVMHDADLEEFACRAAARAGMIDMYGAPIPAIDGFGLPINRAIVTLMRSCVAEALKLRETCKTWFEKVLDLGFFESNQS